MTSTEAASSTTMPSRSKVANAKAKHAKAATTTTTNTAAASLTSALNKTPTTFAKENEHEEQGMKENVKALQNEETLQNSNETNTESKNNVEGKPQATLEHEIEELQEEEEKVLITPSTTSLLDPLQVLCLPANMVTIKRFTTLTLTHQCNVIALHPHFLLFSNLQVLVLEHNQLTSLLHLLPPSQRHNVQSTSSSPLSESSGLSFMETHATGCGRLKELFLSYNCLTSLSQTDIPRLRNLELLTLAHNQLDSLEETIHCLRKLQQLRYLDLRFNAFNAFFAGNSTTKHNVKNDGGVRECDLEPEKLLNTMETTKQEKTSVLEEETSITSTIHNKSNNTEKNYIETDHAKYNREAHLYRYYVIYNLPQLNVLDRREVTSDERAKASALFHSASHKLSSKQHTTIEMCANTKHNKHNRFIESDHANSYCSTVETHTSKRKISHILQLSECTKLLNRQYAELVREQKKAEKAKERQSAEEESKLRDQYAAFHLVWTLSQPNMPLCTSGSNNSSINFNNTNASTESKYKRGNSAGSASSSHSGNLTNVHGSNSKRASKRKNSKTNNSTLQSVKDDGKVTVVPNPSTKLPENTSVHATSNEKLPSFTSSSSSLPLSVLAKTSSASTQPIRQNTTSSGNKNKKRVPSAENYTSTSLPSSANSNTSLNNNNKNITFTIGNSLLPLLSSSSSSSSGKGQLSSSLPTIVLPKNKIAELLTIPPPQQPVLNEFATNKSTEDYNEKRTCVCNSNNEITRVPCITRLKEINKVITPAEELVKSLRCTMEELTNTENNDKMNSASHVNAIVTSTTISSSKSGKRSATNSANANNRESTLGIMLTKEQIELLQKIEVNKSDFIPPPWKEEIIDRTNTNTFTYKKNTCSDYNLEKKIKEKIEMNVSNMDLSTKMIKHTDLLHVNKRDVIIYTLRAIQLLFTPQELLALQNKYGDNLLHRALKSLNENVYNDIVKKNTYSDDKNNNRIGENITSLSFERIFSGKPKEVIPIKSKSELRKHQQQQQQKANARASSRNRHTQMTSTSGRLGEEMSEEELELQRVREEEQKHMELFWNALTQPALIPAHNRTNTEQPFSDYGVGANKNTLPTASTTSAANTNNYYNSHSNSNNFTSRTINTSNNAHVKKVANNEVGNHNNNNTHPLVQQKASKKLEGKNALHIEDEADKEDNYVSSMIKGTVGSYSLTTLITFVQNLCFCSHYNELDLNDLLNALMTCHHYTQALNVHENSNSNKEINEALSSEKSETSKHYLHKNLSASALNALCSKDKWTDETHRTSLMHSAKEAMDNVDKINDTRISSKQSKEQEQRKRQEKEMEERKATTISSGSSANKEKSQNKNNMFTEQSLVSSSDKTSLRSQWENSSTDKDRKIKNKEKHHTSNNTINNHSKQQNNAIDANANNRSVVADKAKSSHGQSEVHGEHTNTKNKTNGRFRDDNNSMISNSTNKDNEFSDTTNNNNNNNDDDEKEEMTPSLTINNLLCALCYYVPFVEQRLRFMREECANCISALHLTHTSESNKLKDNASNKKRKSSYTANSENEINANCELSNWFARVSFLEKHLERLRKINQEDAIQYHTFESVKTNKVQSNEKSESVNTNCKQADNVNGKIDKNNIIILDKLLVQPVQSVGSYFVDNKTDSNDVK